MKKLIIFLSAILLAQLSFAQTSEKTAQKAYEVSGIKDQILMIDQMVNAQIAQKSQELGSEEAAEIFAKVMKSSFSSEKMNHYMLEYYRKNCNEDSLKMVIKLMSR